MIKTVCGCLRSDDLAPHELGARPGSSLALFGKCFILCARNLRRRFSLDNFVRSPSWVDLETCKKADLLIVSNHLWLKCLAAFVKQNWRKLCVRNWEKGVLRMLVVKETEAWGWCWALLRLLHVQSPVKDEDLHLTSIRIGRVENQNKVLEAHAPSYQSYWTRTERRQNHQTQILLLLPVLTLARTSHWFLRLMSLRLTLWADQRNSGPFCSSGNLRERSGHPQTGHEAWTWVIIKPGRRAGIHPLLYAGDHWRVWWNVIDENQQQICSDV